MFRPLLSSNGKVYVDDQKMQWYIAAPSGDQFHNTIFNYKDIKEVFITDGKATSTKVSKDKSSGLSNIGRNAAIYALTGVGIATVKTTTRTTVSTKQIDVCNVNVILKSTSTPLVFQCQNELTADSLFGEFRRMKENGEKYSTHRPLYGLDELKSSRNTRIEEKPQRTPMSTDAKFLLFSLGVIACIVLFTLLFSSIS